MKNSIVQICVLLLFFCSTVQKMNFERNLFVYWETPMNQAPLTVKVSYEKLEIAANRDGWKLHLITGSNIKDYLPDFDRFNDVVSRGHRKTVHEKSDILRIYLIEQHGGVWLDFSSVLFQNLDWLSDDQLFDQLIINKIGTNQDDPDMLMIGQGYHQSPYSYYNSDNRLVSQEYFGTAIHFIAAKRKSKIMTAWKQKYDDLVTKSFKEMMPQIIQRRIYLKNIYQEGVYLSGNIAFQHVIQQTQQSLDDNIHLWNVFSQRQNVYQHFKIWLVHGEVGPIVITRHDRLHISDLFAKTLQEVQQKTGKLWFYVKINGYWRWQVQGRQQRVQKYFRDHPDITVEKILKRGPNDEECQLFFIVKGSIMHMLYQNSKYKDEIKTPFISVDQRTKLGHFCASKNPEMYQNKDYPQWAIGQVTKAIRETQYANMTSLRQKLQIFSEVYKREIDLARQRWEEAVAAIILYLTFRNLVHFAKLLFLWIRKTIRDCTKTQKIFILQSLKDNLSFGRLKALIHQKFTKQNLFAVFSFLGFSILGIVLLVAKGAAYTFNHQFFEQFDWNGYLGHWTKLAVLIGYNVILDWVIGKFLNHKYVNTFVSMETILKETRVLLYLPLGYVAVLHMYILFGFAHHHTMNFVAGGILVYVWLEEIKERRIGFSLLYKIESILANTKWAFLGLFLLYRLNRNIRYIRFEQHYAKELLADMLNDGFWILLYSLTLVAGVYFFKKLFVIECTEVQRGPQTEAEKEQRVTKRADIYHSLFMVLIIWLVVSKTSQIYDSKMSSPYSFNYLALYKILLGLYMLCHCLIRLSLSTRMFSMYGILLTCLSFLPIMYWYYGEEFQGWFDWRPHIKKQCQNLIIFVFIIIEQFRKVPDKSDSTIEETDNTEFEKVQSFTQLDHGEEI